ncbi:MAG: 16S rRNA (cytidine(1402)-2'-O)-methyltransferase [Acidimicrobiales bacterium]
MSGTLVLVATPIGNLGDLAPRAVEELDGAALVCCEDTRRTGRLLAHAGVADARLRRVDDHTERRAAAEVLDLLASGSRVALVSDAGTPGISDPGARLVDAVLDAGFEVSVVPGPVAAIAALVASGLPTDRFVFEGFLPRKGRERGRRLDEIAHERRTVVLYESPNRIGATLVALAEVCGAERRAVVARELTKLHEEFVRGTLAELSEWAVTTPKGEIVLVIEGAPEADEATDDEILAALRTALDTGSSARDAADSVATALGVGRRRAYQLTLGIPGGVTPPS